MANSCFLLIFLIITLDSCQKNSSADGSGSTGYLTQQAWKISKYEQKTNSGGTYVDQFPAVPACSRDDEYKFDVNFIYQITEGATKCNPSDPYIIFTGFWQLLQNETILKLDNTQCPFFIDGQAYFPERNAEIVAMISR